MPALTATDSAAKDQVVAATAAWVDAFNSRDPARVAALYDAEAILTDASEPRPRVGSAEIAEYYRKAAQRPTQRVALGERNLRLLGDTAIDSGTLTYFEMRDGNATTTPGRYSLTYQKRGGKWLIVDHQSSAAPRSVMSAGSARQGTLRCLSSAAVSCSAASVRATSATRAPSSPKRVATERPMPRPAPVTMTVWPWNFMRSSP